jgi:hypothetical protein
MLKPKNRHGDLEAQITKPKLPILRHKSGNPPPPWFWGATKKLITGIEAKPGEIVVTSFEAKLEKTVATGFEDKSEKTVAPGFEAKLLETVAASFEVKPAKIVWVVLRLNHSQTVNLGFEAQPRNPRSSSLCVRCRPHTAPPDLSITWPPSTWHVWPSPVLCTRSTIPAMILIAARHATPATCTLWDKQRRFSKWNKDKRKTKWNYSGFKFKPHQVNNSSQSNQETDHLVFHLVSAYRFVSTP